MPKNIKYFEQEEVLEMVHNHYDIGPDVRDKKSEYIPKHLQKGDGTQTCVSCGSNLETLSGWHSLGAPRRIDNKTMYYCMVCHWYSLTYISGGSDVHGGEIWPIIRTCSIASDHIPITELRKYLLKKYSDVGHISANKSEELVRSVFEDFKPDAEIHFFKGSATTRDEGIDLVIIAEDESVTAVQVKRRINKKSEPVSDVDRFVTAIIKKGISNGLYVSLNSRFSSEAQKVPNNLHIRKIGIELELIDNKRFFDILQAVDARKQDTTWSQILNTRWQPDSNPKLLKFLQKRYG